jgi:hypothetical protein
VRPRDISFTRCMTLVPVDGRTVAHGGPLAGALELLDVLARVAWVPDRPAPAAVPRPEAQFDLDAYVPPARVVDGVRIRFEPVHTVFVTAVLDRAPTRAGRERLADALAMVEEHHPWAPGGLFLQVGYGLPYFRRLPRGLFDLYVPRPLADTRRFALAGPEAGDDLLLTMRSDDPLRLIDVLTWLGGQCGFTVTSARVMFAQPGLPRRLAVRLGLPYAALVSPHAASWLGDEHPEPAPARAVTFAGSRLTTAAPGDYFDAGAVQHLACTAVDPRRFADHAGFTERVRHLFRTASGGPGPEVPPHQRIEGPGLGPVLHRAIIAPTASVASAVSGDAGQAFLVPPLRHRAFPLVELA